VKEKKAERERERGQRKNELKKGSYKVGEKERKEKRKRRKRSERNERLDR
jgi:hypothetical protein